MVRHFTESVCEALDEIDLLAMPTTQVTAPAFGQVTDSDDLLRTNTNTSQFDLTGHLELSLSRNTESGESVDLQPVAP